MSPFLAHPAFDDMFDDMEKTAAGMCRSGKPPIKVHNLMKKASVMDKIAAVGKKDLATAAAGALAYETLRRANEDRKLGRQIRKQQMG